MFKIRNNYLKWGFVATIATSILIIGWYWLAMILLMIIVIIKALKHMGVVKWLKKKRILYYPSIFISILLASVFVRLFFVELYTIPSNSMENTIMAGDKIVAEKLSFGPRLPKSPFEIPWINLLLYMNENIRNRAKEEWWSYRRWNGSRKVKQNDVIIFNHPNRKNINVFVKRCVGLSGDTITMRSGFLHINGRNIVYPEFALDKYQVNYYKYDSIKSYLQQNNIRIHYHSPEKNLFILYSSPAKIKNLAAIVGIDSISLYVRRPDTLKYKVFPRQMMMEWSFENYGPYIVPFRGMTIPLNDSTYNIYSATISRNEMVKIDKYSSGGYYHNNRQIQSYTFKKDYYFMMGDNRQESYDSRGWGVVPEEMIIGRTSLVLFSIQGGKVNWRRLFKRIR